MSTKYSNKKPLKSYNRLAEDKNLNSGENSQEKLIDKRKMIIYSELMKPKFDD